MPDSIVTWGTTVSKSPLSAAFSGTLQSQIPLRVSTAVPFDMKVLSRYCLQQSVLDGSRLAILLQYFDNPASNMHCMVV